MLPISSVGPEISLLGATRAARLARVALGSAALWLACSAAPGRFTTWAPTTYDPRAEDLSLTVYPLEYDSIFDELRPPDRLPSHDTIGIIVHEPKLVAEFESREDYWRYDERVVRKLQDQARELGGDAILLGSPRIGRRGLSKMLRDFVAHTSLESHSDGTDEISEFTKNPWVAHIAVVIRSAQ